MKFHVFSDLHIEFSHYEIPVQEADVLVLAGDIGNGMAGIAYAQKYKEHYKHVIYVPGNHEFYGQNISHLSIDMKHVAKDAGIILLDNDTIVIDDIAIIGSTLWTDFKLYGEKLEQVGYYMNKAQTLLSDFTHIRYGTWWFSPSNCAKLSVAAQAFIAKALEEHKSRKRVVITHHCPSMKSVHEKYAGSPINPCFSNNLDSLAAKADVWIHGHTHDSYDYQIENCRVVCNPRGYSNHQHKQENVMFKPDFIIEV